MLKLPSDFRTRKYVPRNKYDEQIIATVDVVWSRNEILMHDETNDIPFTVTPNELKNNWRCFYED